MSTSASASTCNTASTICRAMEEGNGKTHLINYDQQGNKVRIVVIPRLEIKTDLQTIHHTKPTPNVLPRTRKNAYANGIEYQRGPCTLSYHWCEKALVRPNQFGVECSGSTLDEHVRHLIEVCDYREVLAGGKQTTPRSHLWLVLSFC